MVVFCKILADKFQCVFVFYRIIVFHQVVDRTVVYMITQFQLGFHLVAIRNGYIIHLVAETYD